MKVHIVRKWKSTRAPNYEMYQNPSRFVRWYFWKRLDVALKMCNINREDIVLDVGCWMGYFLPTLALHANNVIGLDMWDGVCDAGAWDKRVVGWSTTEIVKELVNTELGSDNNIELIKIDLPSEFHIFMRQLTPEFVTTRYPDAAYGTPYELYDEDAVNEILKNSKEVLKWIGSQIQT